MSTEFPFEHFFTNTQSNITQFNFQGSRQEELPAKKVKTSQHTETTKTLERELHHNNSLDLNEFQELSEGILNLLKDRIPKSKFSAFFENTISLKGIKGNEITFTCPTNFVKHIIESQYIGHLASAVSELLGKKIGIKLDIENQSKSLSSNDQNILKTSTKINLDRLDDIHASLAGDGLTNQSKDLKARKPGEFKFTLDYQPTTQDLVEAAESKVIEQTKPQFTNIAINPNQTFDNFIVGNSNAFAQAIALAIAKEPSRPGSYSKYQTVYVHSSSGLGKTHLLCAIANKLKQSHPSLVVSFLTAREFFNEMVSAMQSKTLNDFQRKYCEVVDVLIIDDIHELKNKHATQNEFFHIFNELHNRGKQLIFTSDRMPNEIDGIPERIRTRLQWGLIIDIQKPDIETRLAILKQKAHELDLYLQDEIFNLIASNITTSIRELESQLIRLSVHRDMLKVEIDLDMAKNLLDLRASNKSDKLSIDSISRSVANFYNLPIVDLKSKSRTKKIATSRHVAMYLIHKITGTTLAEIGQYFGGRDHTSVIHGIRKIESEIKIDTFLFDEIRKIEDMMRNPSEVF